MKHFYILSIFTFSFLFVNSQCVKENFALHELFTSDGCDACPNDNHKFNNYAQDFDNKGLNVIMLAHHVTSFDGPLPGPCPDSLGNNTAWKDHYAKPEHDTTQMEYVTAIDPSPVVLLRTPQHFVQGKYGTAINLVRNRIVGLTNVLNKVNAMLAETPKSGVCIEYVSNDEIANTITFNYTLIDSDNNGTEQLVYFVYEDKLYGNKITAGENCNLVLDHDKVRRNQLKKSIVSLADETGTLTIDYPMEAKEANLGISAFLQETATSQAVGGTKGFKLGDFITTSTDEVTLESYDVTAYPNPASQHVNFNLGTEMDYIEIFDLTGKIVQSAYNVQNGSYTMNLTDKVTPGMYMFRVGSRLTSASQKVGKLIIK